MPLLIKKKHSNATKTELAWLVHYYLSSLFCHIISRKNYFDGANIWIGEKNIYLNDVVSTFKPDCLTHRSNHNLLMVATLLNLLLGYIMDYHLKNGFWGFKLKLN